MAREHDPIGRTRTTGSAWPTNAPSWPGSAPPSRCWPAASPWWPSYPTSGRLAQAHRRRGAAAALGHPLAAGLPALAADRDRAPHRPVAARPPLLQILSTGLAIVVFVVLALLVVSETPWPAISPHADDHDNELVHHVAALERTALSWERTGIGCRRRRAALHLREESLAFLVLGIVLILTRCRDRPGARTAALPRRPGDVLASASVVLPWALPSLSLVVAAVGRRASSRPARPLPRLTRHNLASARNLRVDPAEVRRTSAGSTELLPGRPELLPGQPRLVVVGLPARGDVAHHELRSAQAVGSGTGPGHRQPALVDLAGLVGVDLDVAVLVLGARLLDAHLLVPAVHAGDGSGCTGKVRFWCTPGSSQ